MALLDDGKLRAHISDRFELADIRAAHAKLDTGDTTGKIVVHIAD
jgi:NADPH:quinone reductase-like Zn-dependent oxidoreductase